MKPEGEAEAVDGARLCLACGLCCLGLLHEWARLQEREIPAAHELGLRPEVLPDGPAFALPCPCHQDGRCTVYEQRLSPCREYRCKLLREYQDGQVTWDEGLRRVRRAQQLVAALRQRLGSPKTGGIWQQIRAAASQAVAEPETQLDVAALSVHCQRYFWRQPLAAGDPFS